MNSQHYIILENLHIFARHGVAPQETTVGNDFIISLRIGTDFTRAFEQDDLDGTISYADLTESIKKEMAIPSKLLEHVGGRIVRRLFDEYPSIQSVELKLCKRNPPMGADIDTAGIELHCQRS